MWIGKSHQAYHAPTKSGDRFKCHRGHANSFFLFQGHCFYEAKLQALKIKILGKSQHFVKPLNAHAINKLAEIGGVNADIICQVLMRYQLKNMRASFQ